jgi:tetratricopeptide (TPR) repeat protein
MTGRIEKTVFISYRRTNFYTALAVYQDLTAHGYDVFFDFQSIDSGDFERIITENIKAKVHFLVILSPSALERCNEPGDWLRREIEIAIEERRNIVPLMMEGFDFGSPAVKQALTGKLASLDRYNGLRLVSDYFFEAMEKLRDRFLNKAVEDIPLHPLSAKTREINKIQRASINEVPAVDTTQLTAQEWFERGYLFAENHNPEEAIRCYSKAIAIRPDFVEAYNNRGNARFDLRDLDNAISDYAKAIRMKPDYIEPYYNCAIVLEEKKDYSRAIYAYQRFLDLKGGNKFGKQKEVEELIAHLRTKSKELSIA